MALSTRLPTRRPRRHLPRVHPAPRPQPEATRAPAPSRRPAARRAGGPEDHALYACLCGFAFTAAVTTSVGCPHCGTEQAW